MIRNRPKALLELPHYDTVHPPPYARDWSAVPALISLSLITLDGIQPITTSMAQAAGGELSAIPNEGQIEYFRQRKCEFQLIFVVASCISFGFDDEGHQILRPYALTLIPASKRGQAVSQTNINFVTNVIVGNPMLAEENVYSGFDPFQGEWQLFGAANLLLSSEPRKGFIDEIGFVTDHFVLATQFDPKEVCAVNLDMPSPEVFQRYIRHRTKLFFTPFEKLERRRIWGVESPIELFLLQGLAAKGHFPLPQMILAENGSAFASLYDLWNDAEFRETKGLITEVDLYFPDQKVAVFCDGSHHRHRKQRERDQRIDQKLLAIGIKPVRVRGKEIVKNFSSAVSRVLEVIEG